MAEPGKEDLVRLKILIIFLVDPTVILCIVSPKHNLRLACGTVFERVQSSWDIDNDIFETGPKLSELREMLSVPTTESQKCSVHHAHNALSLLLLERTIKNNISSP